MARKLDILIAEDDADDAALIRAAIRIHGIKKAAIHSVPDGHKAIAYLEGLGEFSNRRKYPFPNLIVSALKMPRKSSSSLSRKRRARLSPKRACTLNVHVTLSTMPVN